MRPSQLTILNPFGKDAPIWCYHATNSRINNAQRALSLGVNLQQKAHPIEASKRPQVNLLA